MNVCVVRFQKDKDKGEKDKGRNEDQEQWRYLGFATTDLSCSARQIIQTYQTRPEIEEDYRQLKSASWRVDQFCATRLVQIIWHVLLTLLAYNLFQVYANTRPGRAFAGKTKQKIEREQRRSQKTYLLVCTSEGFGVYETKALLYLLLDLPDDVRQKVRQLLPKRLE